MKENVRARGFFSVPRAKQWRKSLAIPKGTCRPPAGANDAVANLNRQRAVRLQERMNSFSSGNSDEG
jgi:hypothetical protein